MYRTLIFVILFSSSIVSAQTLEINSKFLCYLSDPDGPRLFQNIDGIPTELTFDSASSKAQKLVRKAKKKIRRLKSAGAARKKLRRARKNKKNKVAAKNQITACQDGSIALGALTFDPPESSMTEVDVIGSPDTTLTGTCTLAYSKSPDVIGAARSLADKTLVDITCNMNQSSSSAATGAILWGPNNSRGNVMEFIAGLNLTKDSFSIISCDFSIGVDCDRTQAMITDLADPNGFVGIEFSFAGNQFSGQFPF